MFCVDKPLGWTSFAVVKKVRGTLRKMLGSGNVKVGHAGTLDPLATGVLIVCTGRMTKQIEQLQAGVKEYIADIRLGATTPSFDLETEIDAQYPWQHITREQIDEVLQSKFVGTIEQVPPKFSACKVDGKPAYKLARKGKDVEIRPKTLVIDEIEVLACGLPAEPTLQVRVVCSKGTYIRALARDIGEALGSGGHLTALRRTRVGDTLVTDCHSVDSLLEYLEGETYVTPEEAEARRLEQERADNKLRAATLKAKRAKKQHATQTNNKKNKHHNKTTLL